MRDPETGNVLSVSIRPLSVCLNCGRSTKIAFAVPARHDLELRVFQCEHCSFEEMILRPHCLLPAQRLLTKLVAPEDETCPASSDPIYL